MADATRTVTTEQIMADAVMVSTFLRSLIAESVTMAVASSLASTYLQAHVLTRAQHEKPKDPWEGKP